jgi:hypothetical protein
MLSHTHARTHPYLPFDTHMHLFLSFPRSTPFELFRASPHTISSLGSFVLPLFLSLSFCVSRARARARSLSLVLCFSFSPPPPCLVTVSDSEDDAESDSDSGTPINPAPPLPYPLSVTVSDSGTTTLARTQSSFHPLSPACAHMTFSFARALSKLQTLNQRALHGTKGRGQRAAKRRLPRNSARGNEIARFRCHP